MKRRTRRQINIEKVAGVLTLDQLTRFVINCDKPKIYHYWFSDVNRSCFESELDVLQRCFPWYLSNEGREYWLDIFNSIRRYYE